MMTPLQENLQMAKRTGQRSFDYAMNAKEEANKLLVAMQHAHSAHLDEVRTTGTTSIGMAHDKEILEKHERLMEKSGKILEAATKINEALNILYDLDLSEFF